MSGIEEAAALLREAGWIVLPPPSEAIPEPKVGQVWASAMARVEPRTIVAIGPGRGWASNRCIHFTTPSRPVHLKWGASLLEPESWKRWVRKSGARPV